jgi:zinc protease
MVHCRHPIVWALAAILAAAPAAAFDLATARVTQLDNGLALVVLEDPRLPVVSVQALYRVGARNEPLGRWGIAHFLEHMAFRATESFPDTDVVSRIYAVGGEWHGYTWLDQTTYFETLPVEHLDLALRIEADRMARALIAEADVEPERGAVLGEMHGYENDPATVLNDAVLAVSFLQHPYRNNTIGWESDVEAITHDDLVAFYRRHYRPANAVLAVVGRVTASAVEARVRELFGFLPADGATPPPPTVEPPQRGVRRVTLDGAGSRSRFTVAYRAPSVGDPDFPAFLLLQEVLGGGRGVNFAQNTFGDAVRPGTRLAGIADDLATWYPPQADPYVLTLAGSVDAATAPADLEARLEAAVAAMRGAPPSEAELAAARHRLEDELVFDVETTEDAAHQLAFYVGLDALDVVLELPRSLAAVTPSDVQRLARRYLEPWQRTIGWYLAGKLPPAEAEVAAVAAEPAVAGGSAETAVPSEALAETLGEPVVLRLAGGLPVLFQRLPLSSAAYLRLLVPATGLDFAAPGVEFSVSHDVPIWRHTSVDFRLRPGDLAATVEAAAAALRGATPEPPVDPSMVEDPATRLALELDAALRTEPASSAGDPGLTAIALVGDLRQEEALPLLEAAFGDRAPRHAAPAALAVPPVARRVTLDVAKAQAQLGYVVAAPAAGVADACAWRSLLYVLSHGYEGRLGKEAISRRGLLYYIDARYASDGEAGRVSLEMGVDPAKKAPLRELLVRSLAELQSMPPSADEVAEARAHLLGRRASAAQSDEEVSARLLADWMAFGELPGAEEYAARAASCDRDDVLRAVPSFVAGAVVSVEVGE